MRIVFMGTPDFAAASLAGLLEENFTVCGVFTKADKPRNRGMRILASPVKELAAKARIPIFQPENLKNDEASSALRKLRPDLIAVVAYGHILPEFFLSLPEKGCVNIHASLLPQYRGAAPIQWSVLNGDLVTGVTSMYMDQGLDTGDIIYSSQTKIGEFETSGELYTRLRDMGARLLCRTLRDIEKGAAPRVPQDGDKASYAKPLAKEMSPIDWNKSPREIVKWICGLNPWPVATATLGGQDFRIFMAEYSDAVTDRPPGCVVSADRRGILVSCGRGETLMITQIQVPGGKRMRAGDYLLGNQLQAGE